MLVVVCADSQPGSFDIEGKVWFYLTLVCNIASELDH